MNGNFLTNYSYTDELVNFMRCCFAITQTLTYPLELFVARHSIHALFFASEKKFTDAKHYVITLLLWGSSLAIALNVTDLGIVLELTGGVSAVFIGFVMPALLHFNLSSYNYKLWLNPVEKRVAAAKELLPSIWLLVFGILAMAFTIITIGGNLVYGHAGPHDAYEDGSNGLSQIETDTNYNRTRLL
jgi:sodium-coupled neutral amino acid transporter 11